MTPVFPLAHCKRPGASKTRRLMMKFCVVRLHCLPSVLTNCWHVFRQPTFPVSNIY